MVVQVEGIYSPPRVDKTAMRPFVRILWRSVIITLCCTVLVSVIVTVNARHTDDRWLFDWQEYEGLTNKIHDLQTREQQLHEVLFDHHRAVAPPDDDVLMVSDSQQSTMFPGAAADMTVSHASALQDDDCASPCAKMRSVVRAHLPKKMTTVVSLLTYLHTCLDELHHICCVLH